MQTASSRFVNSAFRYAGRVEKLNYCFESYWCLWSLAPHEQPPCKDFSGKKAKKKPNFFLPTKNANINVCVKSSYTDPLFK